MRKVILTATAFLIALAAAILILIVLAGRDEPAPPSDADLVLERRRVADWENGYSLLLAPREGDAEAWLPEWPEDDERVDALGQAFDRAEAARLLEGSEAVMTRVEECLMRPDFVVPEEKDPGITGSSPIEAWGRVKIIIACRSRWLAEEGRQAESLETAIVLVALGDRIRRSQGNLVVHAGGDSLSQTGLALSHRLIARSGLDRSTLERAGDRLEKLSIDDRCMEDSLRVQYFQHKAFVERLGSAGGEVGGLDGIGLAAWEELLPVRVLFHPHRTLRELGDLHRHLLAWSKMSHSARRREAERLLASAESSERPTRNAVGRKIVELAAVGGTMVLHEDSRTRHQLAVLRAGIALRLHRLRHGGWPGRLEELVPELLEEVPRDPVDDRPLRWSAEKGHLYSIGADGIDGGGSPAPVEEALEDPQEPTLRLAP